MLTQTPHSATSSPHPQRVPVGSLAKGTRRASRQQIGRRRTRASLAANALNNRGSGKQGLGVALARNPVGGGLENLSKPATGTIQKIHYLTGGDGSLFAMYVIDQNNQGKMYYIYTDHLGSPNLITDAECNVVQELSYDACCVKLGFCEHSETKPLVEPIPSLREGNRRDPATWQPYTSLASIPSPLIDRGFTFHEHLYPFTLINMNGRAYDPLVGRFLSADPYIQAPDNPQNLNRYSYCLNNPLRYTDPSGEWFGLDDLVVAGVGFVFGYVSHGISSGNWGAPALAQGAGFAASAWVGYNTCGIATASEGMTAASSKAVAGYLQNMAINAVASNLIPPINIPLTENFSLSLSPAFMFGTQGFDVGASVGATYAYRDANGFYNVIGLDVGMMAKGGSRIGGGWEMGKGDFGFGVYSTRFGKGTYPSQQVAGYKLRIGEFSARYENDGAPFTDYHGGGLNDGGDAYRTAAVQLAYKDFNIRLNIMTGDYKTASGLGKDNLKDYPNGYYTGGNVDDIRLGALSVGYGNYSFGVNSEKIRHVFQNQFAHGIVSKQPAFRMLNNNWNAYSHYGTRSRYTLW